MRESHGTHFARCSVYCHEQAREDLIACELQAAS